MARDDRVLRPFWLHQIAEYLIGLALVAIGLQSPDPFVPTVAGALIVVNAAMVDGPLGAFRGISRRTHRTIDLVLIIGLVVAAVLPWGVDNTSRIMLLIVAAVLAVVWWNSAFTKRAPADPGQQVDRTEVIGRSAGRLAGQAAKAIRDRANRADR
jgi:hypothetical protein